MAWRARPVGEAVTLTSLAVTLMSPWWSWIFQVEELRLIASVKARHLCDLKRAGMAGLVWFSKREALRRAAILTCKRRLKALVIKELKYRMFYSSVKMKATMCCSSGADDECPLMTTLKQ
eukprot:892908-Prorocentrum_minimum.AAC.2